MTPHEVMMNYLGARSTLWNAHLKQLETHLGGAELIDAAQDIDRLMFMYLVAAPLGIESHPSSFNLGGVPVREIVMNLLAPEISVLIRGGEDGRQWNDASLARESIEAV